MEVILLKSHDGNNAGSVIDVTPERANYLVSCKVAAYTEGYVAPNVQKQTKEQKAKLEKK
ncbi:hypothetical protein [Pedobacter africanus]|nr:hypothetical protein [Pedobacter africanus]